MRSIASFFLLVVLSVASFAQGTCCVCEIGLKPAYQRSFFYKGCEMWLKEQKNCSTKEIRDHQSNGIIPLNHLCHSGKLRLGYVGHWSSWAETHNHVMNAIHPTMDHYNVNVYIDNTACLGLDDPEKLLRYYRMNKDSAEATAALSKKKESSLPFRYRGEIHIRAHQVRSIGMWDRIFSSSANFDAFVSLNEGVVLYPTCRKFEDKPCEQAFQAGDQGVCIDDSGQKRTLKCCSEIPFDTETPNRFYWTAPDKCAR
ncbi:MAG: hypothetical protein N2578_08260 [Bdellovibrionaceae bacterium]|nr:hypothetical protein [Pseudobdellovibrionaceae bacterium]